MKTRSSDLPHPVTTQNTETSAAPLLKERG